MDNNKLRLVLLIDDDEPSNMINEKVIKKHDFSEKVVAFTSGLKGLAYLNEIYEKNQPLPQLIFLDINMPAMNGWEFLEEFNKLDFVKDIMVVMLTTSLNPGDVQKARATDSVKGFRNKPLNAAMLGELSASLFIS